MTNDSEQSNAPRPRSSLPSAGVTLRDVARAANVHPATVSRALSGGARSLVNDETAQRIQEIANELGYRPNAIARGLKTRQSSTVGVLIPDLTNPLFSGIVRGIQDCLERSGYTPLIANTDNDPVRERKNFEVMTDHRVDGFITATATLEHELLSEFARQLPLVLVNRRLEDAALPAVAVDDRAAIGLAVKHLISLGHRHIAHLAGPQSLSTGRQRLLGFREAMNSAGVEASDSLVRVSDGYNEASGAKACSSLLDARGDVTAIIAANDLLALGCYDVLAKRGLSCPRDISILGFNDMPFASRFSPALTTIHVPHRELGRTAASLLLDLLQAPEAGARQILLPASLVVRDSTAPVGA
jgi:LacI family transcriptional regulator